MARLIAVQQARRFLLWSGLLLVPCYSLAEQCGGQNRDTHKVEGYVTAVHAPNRFEINGTPMATTPATHYGVIDAQTGKFSQTSVQVGAYVCVEESTNKSSKTASAVSVLFRDDSDKKLHGFGLIDKVIVTGSVPLFRADGYRIRIAASTELSFRGDLKALADIKTNAWIKYEGKEDKAGILQAERAEFYSAPPIKEKSDKKATEIEASMRAYDDPAGSVIKDSIIDWDGHLLSAHTKVRYSDAGNSCGWYRVPADRILQERIHRVGARVVPLFQRQLADDDSMKIQFRFYAVDEPKIRTDIFCHEGVILVPRQVVERLQNDDQLAALLADGVAFDLQVRSARLAAARLGIIGTELVGNVAGAFVPGLNLAFDAVGGVAQHRVLVTMEEQRGRMALGLLADAGYDPWQAPEAWRLLASKNLPKDTDSLKYPGRSGYQLSILNLEYSKPNADASAVAAVPVDSRGK